MLHEISVPITCDLDIVAARQKGRAMASAVGFQATDVTIITTAISELARNIVIYARRGEIVLRTVNSRERHGLVVEARDDGPGISNLQQALRDGFSTSGGLGLGLPGVKRLMDDFEITSTVGQGTVVTVKKWLK